jgi:hypothetical protein
MQLNNVLGRLMFNTAVNGYDMSRALNGAYAAANAPIQIHPRLVINHFNRIHGTNFDACAAANAFL